MQLVDYQKKNDVTSNAFDDDYVVVLYDKSSYWDAQSGGEEKEKEYIIPLKVGERHYTSTDSGIEVVEVNPATHEVVIRHYSSFWKLSPEDPEELIWDRSFRGGNVGEQYGGHSYLKITLKKSK